MFAISRASPGPSTLIAALIGWHVDGFTGALAAVLAMYIPSSIVVYAAASWWQRSEASPLRIAIERGLAPVAIGLIFAGWFWWMPPDELASTRNLGGLRGDPLLQFLRAAVRRGRRLRRSGPGRIQPRLSPALAAYFQESGQTR